MTKVFFYKFLTNLQSHGYPTPESTVKCGVQIYTCVCQAGELSPSASGWCSLARETVRSLVPQLQGGSNPGPLVTRPWTPLAHPTT